MKNGNCGSCPHLHRCRATNNDECIDTILGRKQYMSNREKQIRTDAIDDCIKTIIDYCGGLPNGMYVNALEHLKEHSNG